VFRLRLLALLLVLAGLTACSEAPQGVSGARGAVPVPVAVAPAEPKAVPVQLRAIGTVQRTERVTVRSRLDGELRKIHFQEGEDVREGDVLFTIDSRPQAAELRQAEANAPKNAAALANARREASRSSCPFRPCRPVSKVGTSSS
jgi:multidrug efflux system membrane fusion protein